MFAKLFREEPEVLAVLAIVAIAVFARPPQLPRYRFDIDTGFPSIEQPVPRIQFIRFR